MTEDKQLNAMASKLNYIEDKLDLVLERQAIQQKYIKDIHRETKEKGGKEDD